MGWQKSFDLPRRSKGCHLVTDSVLAQISEGIKDVKVGMLFLFIQHTSAALSINENFDPDVRKDMDMALDIIVPETLEWRHVDEGRDDSVSHTKATLVGSTISVPITSGALNLGTWQGIYLTEFRHVAHTRRVVATVFGSEHKRVALWRDRQCPFDRVCLDGSKLTGRMDESGQVGQN